MVKTLRDFLESKKDLLERIIGDRKIMISERRSPNTASLLFAKSSFSSTPQTLNNDQRCNARGCILCDNLLFMTVELFSVLDPLTFLWVGL